MEDDVRAHEVETAVPPMTAEDLRDLLRYAPDTGGLFWMPRTPDMFRDARRSARANCAAWNTRYAGRAALSAKHIEGYRHGALLGRHVLAHRAAWAIYYGEWPSMQIDHIDRDRSNNKISNLRLSTQSQNLMNATKRSVATSRHIGVSLNRASGKWVANILGRHMGTFATEEEALSVRRAAERDLFGEFSPAGVV